MRHAPSGRRVLGLGLTLVTVCSWGLLPIMLKFLLGGLDAYTLTWYRFGIAACLLGFYVGLRQGFRVFLSLTRTGALLAIICIVGATGNYTTFLLGLEYLSPGGAQILIQTVLVMTLLGGLVFFHESFSRRQWIGLAVLIIGIALFFNTRYDNLFVGSNLVLGIFWILVSALMAAGYALAQKQLLQSLSAERILLLLYLFGCLLLLPFAQPSQGLALSRFQIGMLVLSSVITLVSYVCYANAMNHIEISQISMVLPLNPLVTVTVMTVLTFLYPGFVVPESLNVLSWIGAGLVVVGSTLGVRRSSNI